MRKTLINGIKPQGRTLDPLFRCRASGNLTIKPLNFILSVLLVSGYSQIPENLPDLLLSQSGIKITDLSQWDELRREELVNLFRQEVYGQIPASFKPSVEFLLEETRYFKYISKSYPQISFNLFESC